MTNQVQTTGKTPKPITEDMAYKIAWGTFIPTAMPDNFFNNEDDDRFEYYSEHVYSIFKDVSHTDLEGTIQHLVNDIMQVQLN